MEKKRLLGWAGGLAGVPIVATVYRRFAARRPGRTEERLYVRTIVEPELVNDLLDLVRRVRGRAAPEGRDTFSVPLPFGAEEDTAYRELRAVLQNWEMRHPGIRAEIVSRHTSAKSA